MGEQEIFWKEIKKIQTSVVDMSLLKYKQYGNNIEMLLNDVTYETIYKIMELFDGFRNESLRYEIVNKVNGISVNKSTGLHDCCEEHLNCSDI
ncbi:MAG: hypothetical protein J6J44_13360 [Lachnospiraceae bacterium]|nr:hypothetical protein [Lachnospiraceae bacterium]